MKYTMKYTKIKWENLIEGNTYYTDGMGINKVIYEGRMEEDTDICILRPIGYNQYLLYTEAHYKGKYTGTYALKTGGHFYEEVRTSIVRTIKDKLGKIIKQ